MPEQSYANEGRLQELLVNYPDLLAEHARDHDARVLSWSASQEQGRLF